MNTAVTAKLAGIDSIPLVDRLAKRVLTGRLAGLQRGTIRIGDDGQSATDEQEQDGKLQATLKVHHPSFFRRAVLGGSLSVAGSYIRGDWDCDDLTSFFRIFVRNREAAGRFDRGASRVINLGHRLYHWWNSNTREGSSRNIGAHYDLGNDFFRLWLDDTLTYSSGIFLDPGRSLREASIEKLDRICRKLELSSLDEVLEIGTGWGSFALHAARNYGCRVTTTTISEEQAVVARQRINDACLDHRVSLLRKDYRDLHGSFNKLVSIEMIEAVGHRFLDSYFGQCSRLLLPDGTFVLQAILMPDRGYDRYLSSVDFIQRYVFPGGCLPSLGSIFASVGRATDFRLVHIEDMAPHYAETLRRWREEFTAHLDEVRELGYGEEFIRLWRYYLCYCEAAFEERYISVAQIQLDKPECRRDPIRISRRAADAVEAKKPVDVLQPSPLPLRPSLQMRGR